MNAWIRRVTALAALIGTVLIGAAGARAELAGKGDEAAWEELNAAFKKLGTVSAYREKTTVGEATMLMEVVLPTSAHAIFQNGGHTHELINVNGQTRFRTTGLPGVPTGWKCGVDSPINFSDSSGLVGTVDDVSRGPDTTIDGMAVRTYVYLYTRSEKAKTAKATTYVSVETGLPRRSVTTTDKGEVVTDDYYDYGAQIEITLPPCG